MREWDHKKVSRGTKCFSAMSATGYPGSYPVGFLEWVKENGWWGEKRIHLCAGGVGVIDPDSDRVDIQEEIDPEIVGSWGSRGAKGAGRRRTKTTDYIIADSRDTGLPDESYDWVGIDPPYSEALAESLYGTEKHYAGIDAFAREGYRLLRPGGYLMTFTYAVGGRPGPDADLVACWGIYQIPNVRNLTCMNVWKKRGKLGPQGLQRWTQ